MKYYLQIIVLLLINLWMSPAQSQTQSVINTAGNSKIQSDIVYEWSLGELALVETMVNSDIIITHGFLQPLYLSSLIVPDNVPIVYPHNILTANGDGKNDVWIIKDIEKYPENEVIIFDRSGRVVYTVKNYQNNWNGTLSGSPLAKGTYYYVIKLTKNAQTNRVKGFISILN